MFYKKFSYKFFSKKSEVSETNFIHMEIERMTLLADIVINNSKFESCEANWVEFRGTEICSCDFNNISGEDCISFKRNL